MNLRLLTQIFSLRDVRNALLGLGVVIGGLLLALFTLYAHRSGNPRMAGIAAVASLIFVLLILVFVVPPLARNASAEASQMNLPFELTIGGAIILGLIVIVGFSAWNTGNNLLFLVLAVLAASLVVGFVAGSMTLSKVDVRMRFPDNVHAGEKTPIVVVLSNRKRILPSFSIIAEVRGRARERSPLADEIKQLIPAKWAERLMRPPLIKHTLDYFLVIPRRGELENHAHHVFPRRGRFTISDFELSTRFPFGFFRHRRRLGAQAAEIYILPSLGDIEADLADLPIEVGKLVANRRGSGQDLLALRDYQPLDDLRRVDWKATARSSRLVVREFSAEDDKRVTIILDPRVRRDTRAKRKSIRERVAEERRRSTVAPHGEPFEDGVSKAAGLLNYFAAELADFRLVIGSDTTDYGAGQVHLSDCLRRLAVIDPEMIDEFNEVEFEGQVLEAVDERDRSHVFLVSPRNASNFSPEFRQSVNILTY